MLAACNSLQFQPDLQCSLNNDSRLDRGLNRWALKGKDSEESPQNRL